MTLAAEMEMIDERGGAPADETPRRARLSVRVGPETKAAFDELRDAISAARLMKRDNPNQSVAIVDQPTGLFVIDFD